MFCYPKVYDVIVIGAGHNGLVCAATLAKAGRKVLVLERTSHAGGAAHTRDFAPSFSVSAGAHLLTHFPQGQNFTPGIFQTQKKRCQNLGTSRIIP